MKLILGMSIFNRQLHAGKRETLLIFFLITTNKKTMANKMDKLHQASKNKELSWFG